MIVAEFARGKRATHNQEALDRPMMTFGIAGGRNPWGEDTMENGTDETWLVSNKEFGRRLVSLACWARSPNSQLGSWRHKEHGSHMSGSGQDTLQSGTLIGSLSVRLGVEVSLLTKSRC